jgi:hypothetical protein
VTGRSWPGGDGHAIKARRGVTERRRPRLIHVAPALALAEECGPRRAVEMPRVPRGSSLSERGVREPQLMASGGGGGEGSAAGASTEGGGAASTGQRANLRVIQFFSLSYSCRCIRTRCSCRGLSGIYTGRDNAGDACTAALQHPTTRGAYVL